MNQRVYPGAKVHNPVNLIRDWDRELQLFLNEEFL